MISSEMKQIKKYFLEGPCIICGIDTAARTAAYIPKPNIIYKSLLTQNQEWQAYNLIYAFR